MQFYLFTTDRCNLNCSYCYVKQDGNDMNADVFNKVIDLVDDNDTISLFGGEPSIANNILLFIDKLKEKKEKPSITFFSNAITYNEVLYKNLLSLENEILIQFSYDGELQSSVSSSKHDTVLKNISKCLLDISTIDKYNNKRLHIQTTVTPDNLSGILYTAKTLHEIGVKNMAISPVIEGVQWTNELIDKFNLIMDTMCESVIDSYRNNDPITYYPLTIQRMNNMGQTTCGAGKDLFSISTNGDIYICHRYSQHFKGNEDFKVGSIFDINSKEELEDISVSSGKYYGNPDNFIECHNCEYTQFCNKCHLVNRLVSNDPFKRPTNGHCEIAQLFKKYNEKFINTLYMEKNREFILQLLYVYVNALNMKEKVSFCDLNKLNNEELYRLANIMGSSIKQLSAKK